MIDERHAARRRRVAALVLVPVAAVAVVVGVVWARTGATGTDPRGTGARTSTPTGRTSLPAPSSGTSSATPSPAPTPARPAPAVGVTFGNRLFGLSRARVDRELDDVVALHMHWIRVDMSWASLQPTSGASFDWDPLDVITAAARRHRLSVVGLLGYTPAWARSAGCSTFTCPPRSAERFARFAASVAARYRDVGVTTYQIWNEPNLDLFWSSPDPLRYRALLAATVTRMRAAAGGLRILFGGLAGAQNGPEDLPAATFLRRACAGRTCQVDAVGYDAYTYPALPSATRLPYNPFQLLINPAAGADGLRASLAAVGLRDTPVWITGFGAPTRAAGSTDPRQVTEARQSAILTDGLRLARSAGGVGGYFVDTLRDSSASGATRDHFGIERSDGSRKSAFVALARALAG